MSCVLQSLHRTPLPLWITRGRGADDGGSVDIGNDGQCPGDMLTSVLDDPCGECDSGKDGVGGSGRGVVGRLVSMASLESMQVSSFNLVISD